MTLRLYNSYGRRLEAFRPIERGHVRMYTCGPTVWNYAHVGNFRTFLFEDVLRRYLMFRGYRVTQVKNITDVEDKIIGGMKKTGSTLRELTEFYTRAFMEDLDALGIERAEHYPRATEHIGEMVALVRRLMEKGLAYRGEDGSFYFNVRGFKRYGRLSGVRLGELRPGARVTSDHYDKEEAQDFALWKSWVAEDDDVFWVNELGKGRPGWHIECSAMSMRYLGESFDIHTGGKDLRFPHHENEIAQSEGATGKRFARYWLHSEFLRIDGAEMHKSLGNIVTLRDLLGRGWNARAVRLFLMSAHYRDELNLTDDSLRQAESSVSKVDQAVRRLGAASAEVEEGLGKKIADRMLRDFTKAMDNDISTPGALAALFTAVREVNSALDADELGTADSRILVDALRRLDGVLGVMKFEREEALPDELAALIREREDARAKRDFRRADEIRGLLRERGILVEDTPRGTVWTRAG